MANGELQQIGTYSIIRLLSTNPTWSLYLGKQRKKDVLIQLLHTPLSTPEASEAFLAHAHSLRRLKHRNMVAVQDVGLLEDTEGRSCGYLVREYVEGEELSKHIPPGSRLAPDEVKRLITPIADALQYAHTHGIVHGNLHPGNILKSARGEFFLTNFSLPVSHLTPAEEGQALPYTAPEILQGKAASAASDQYALAVMAYEWLCGRLPYEASTHKALLRQQKQAAIPAPRSLNEAISPGIERILLQALARNPEDRFQSVYHFSNTYLRTLMGLPVEEMQRPTVVKQPETTASLPATSPPDKKTRRDTPSKTALIIPDSQQASSSGENTETLVNAPVSSNGHTGTTPQPASTGEAREIAPVGSNNGHTDLTSQAALSDTDSPEPGKAATIIPLQTKSRPASSSQNQSSLHRTVTADLEQGGGLSKSLPGYEERLAQLEMATVVARSLTEDTPAIIEAATGTGKALDVDTPIPTLTGWKRMGDLVVGDFVFDEKGQPTLVTAAFDVMYDHKCYEVVFSDGSSIIADAEHEWVSYTATDRKWAKGQRNDIYNAKNFVTAEKLALLEQLIDLSQNEDILSMDEAVALIGGHHWSVRQAAKIGAINPGNRPARYPQKLLLTAAWDRLSKDLREQRRDGSPYSLVTTEEMAATLTVSATQRANHAIPVAAPLCLPDADLPIAPYFLGIWLGDGCSRSNQITTADPDLISEIEKDGYTVRSLVSHPFLYTVDDENGKAVSRWQPGMTGRLRAMGLWRNKHIPALYLRSSEQQRRTLLAGLLDTDGTVNHCGAVEFTTTNQQLAEDVYELVCSLGFRPSLRSGQAKFEGKDCGSKWTIAFTTDQQVFRLQRKVNAHKERLLNYSAERNRFRYVIAVNEVPSRPVRCIQVDSPSHLYLAGRSMIPTHNSLAYLIPIVRSGKKAIISTANKALQEQLFYKDIPFVQQHIAPFEAALVKGMGNYVCLDRLENERNGMQFYAKNADFTRLYHLTEDPDAHFNGDFEMLGFPLPGDIRSRVFADGDQCAWSKCGFFGDCYVRKMRMRADHAQVIVVNHTLLLLDAAMEGFLLPERDVIVIDEAHHLEEEASRSFTVTVSPTQINSLLAQHLLKEHSAQNLQQEVSRATYEAWERLRGLFFDIHKGRVNLQEPLEEGLRLASAIAELGDSLRKERPKDMPEKESTLYDKLLKRTQNLADNVRLVFSVDQPHKFVYYVERENLGGRGNYQFQVSAAPLDVTSWLRERLFDKCNVICTSATLATIGISRNRNGGDGDGGGRTESKGPNFSYFRQRVGLNYADYPEVLERILPLTFDYESNALLYIPRHLPEPAYGDNNPAADTYTMAIAREMYRLVKYSRGRAFLLFSSKRMLDRAFDLMAPHLDYPLLRQGDMTRIELTRRFREEEGAILFGLKSFWEGVDIAGEALSLVVIDKLPFEPPDDPVHEARVAQMKAAGENWFGSYVLPQAVLRLKQGLGRLLRTREDRGVMAILDTRLHTRGYGKQVLNALPPARRTSSIRDVEQFFA
jgi:Rad3-related DNA helicase/serine/threonine protein kinase